MEGELNSIKGRPVICQESHKSEGTAMGRGQPRRYPRQFPKKAPGGTCKVLPSPAVGKADGNPEITATRRQTSALESAKAVTGQGQAGRQESPQPPAWRVQECEIVSGPRGSAPGACPPACTGAPQAAHSMAKHPVSNRWDGDTHVAGRTVEMHMATDTELDGHSGTSRARGPPPGARRPRRHPRSLHTKFKV